MGDYNWFSDKNVQVATEGLREEAKKWHSLADRLTSVASLAAGQGLQPSSFSVIVDGPIGVATTSDLNGGYQKMFDWINALLRQGAAQFEAMAEALKNNADWYDDADANSAQNFDKIASSS
ncbi:MAG TPA: type VII secretion target [Actinoplanes sp.]|nr:type VII secretion target [Actinoplanes sp.]